MAASGARKETGSLGRAPRLVNPTQSRIAAGQPP